MITSHDDCDVKSKYDTGWRRLRALKIKISSTYRLELSHPSVKILHPGSCLPSRICNWRRFKTLSQQASQWRNAAANKNMCAAPAAGQHHNTSNMQCISSISTQPHYNNSGTAICSAHTGHWRGPANVSPTRYSNWRRNVLHSWAYDTRYLVPGMNCLPTLAWRDVYITCTHVDMVGVMYQE